jgi:hypothetical protein
MVFNTTGILTIERQGDPVQVSLRDNSVTRG